VGACSCNRECHISSLSIPLPSQPRIPQSPRPFRNEFEPKQEWLDWWVLPERMQNMQHWSKLRASLTAWGCLGRTGLHRRQPCWASHTHSLKPPSTAPQRISRPWSPLLLRSVLRQSTHCTAPASTEEHELGLTAIWNPVSKIRRIILNYKIICWMNKTSTHGPDKSPKLINS